MTENEIKAILGGILNCWTSLKPSEVKGLFRILISRGILPKCAACDKPIMSIEDFSWDHLIAKSKGGPDLIGNLVPMHVGCNVEKGDTIDDKYFCYIEPELLHKMLKSKPKKRGKTKPTKSKDNDKDQCRRNHIRANGWDMSGCKRR